MPISIQGSRTDLLKPLAAACGIAEKRNTLQIIGNVLLTQSTGSLTATATDLDIQIRTRCPAQVTGEDCSTTVSATKLLECLRALPNGNMQLAEEDHRLKVSSGRSRTMLQTLPPDEFPTVTPEDYTARFSMTCSRFKYLLQMVHFAMASQDIRYFLNGVLLVTNGKTVRTVATDGHRLAICAIELESETEAVEAIVPRKTVTELIKLLPDTDELLTIEIGKLQMRLQFDTVELITKLIEGKYPDWQRVIPTANSKDFLIERDALLSALQRVAILTTDKFKGVRWNLEENCVRVTSTNSEQEQAVDEIAIEYTGAPLEVGFNITYLIDVLSNLKTEKVRFIMGETQNSALITMPDSDAFKYVVMPMRI